MENDGKYVVFKLEDWERYDEYAGLPIDWIKGRALPDATVIRAQDKLSASTLNAYADAATLAGEVIEEAGGVEMAQRLYERADFFRARAEWARNYPTKKFPD